MVFFMAFLLSANLSAQSVTVSGTITDASTKEPLPGVNVLVEGTTTGVVTDFNGKFQIKVPSASSTLVISYMGYVSQQIAVGGKTEINVPLAADVKTMDEVVVIGYGSVKKKDLAGTITTLSSKSLENIPVTSATEALSGRLAGVQVTSTDGSPDAEMIVRVRGGGSVTQSNSPLYIVDGFPVSSLNMVPTSEIENVTVLKDASSTAIYGSQGANGVILITTKSAKSGKTVVSLNSSFQFKQLKKELDVLNPYEYALYNYEIAALTSATDTWTSHFGDFGDIDLYKYQKGHDYQDEFYGKAQTSYIHNVSLSGGTEKTRFLLSANYDKNTGLIKANCYDRYNLNLKIDHDISKNLKFNGGIRYTDITVKGTGTSGGTYKIRTFDGVRRAPVGGLSDYIPVDVSAMSEDDYQDYLQSTMTLEQLADQYWRRNYTKTLILNSSIDWNILKGLSFKSTFSYSVGTNQIKQYYGETTQYAIDNKGLPMVQLTKKESSSYQFNNTLNYVFNIGKVHRFNILAAQEIRSSGSANTYTVAKYFSSNLTPEKIFANLGLSNTSYSGNYACTSEVEEDDRLESFFGRVMYFFNDKYIFAGTVRTDGSNKFSKENRWGTFPSASFAWRVIDEPFMKDQNIFSDFKWRVISYGAAGNNNLKDAQYKTSYSIDNSTKPYGVGDVANAYYTVSNTELANPTLKWETTITRNTGIDFGLLNDRINGSVDLFWNTSKDLLITSSIVAAGYTSMTENIGKTSNKGIDINVNGTIIKSKDFNLQANFNISFTRSNLDQLSAGVNSQSYTSGWGSTDIKGSDDYLIKIGKPVGLMYGFKYDGIYTTDDFDPDKSVGGNFVLKSGIPSDNALIGGAIGVRPGTIKLKDTDGNHEVNLNDRDIIGNANPKHTGGFSLQGNYKNIDFTVMFNWSYGNDIYNATKIVCTQNYRTSNYNNNLLNIMNSSNRYTYLNSAGGIVTDLATLKEMNETGSNKKTMWAPTSFGNSTLVFDSWAVEDGSFLRLQNITVGYTMPEKWLSKLAITKFRLFCTLTNVWVWTNYSGFDPEVSTNIKNSSYNQLTPGVDYSAFPKSFGATVGANLNF